MSAQYRRVAFFRRIIDWLFAEARQFRPRPSVWLSEWLSKLLRQLASSERRPFAAPQVVGRSADIHPPVQFRL